ncbi:MAG: tetratricopeptide repeat protein [Bacteroidota bacterium]
MDDIATSTLKSHTRRKKFVWIVAISIIIIGMIVYYFEYLRYSSGELNPKTIAVLPFVNTDGDPNEEYFSNGVTEDILTQLSKIEELNVISSRTMMQFKGSKKSYGEIGKELEAGTILVGSVEHEENQIGFSIQLINVESNQKLWEQTYECKLMELFQNESNLVETIASQLKVKLTQAKLEQINKKPTHNTEAYIYYLKGRQYYRLYKKNENVQAIEMFKNGIALDPNFALAYTGLADAYAMKALQFGYPQVWLDTAISISNVALSIDSTIAEGYKSLGLAYYTKGWFSKALEYNAKAIELNPNYSEAISNFGVVLSMKGELREGLRWIKKSILLDPTLSRNFDLRGSIYSDLTLDSLSVVWFTKALESDPNDIDVRVNLAWQYIDQKNYAEALRQSQKAKSIDSMDTNTLEVAGFISLLLKDELTAKMYLTKNIASDSTGEGGAALGYLLYKSGKQEKAIELFNAIRRLLIHELDDGNEWYNIPYILAAQCAVQKKTPEFYRWFQRAIDAGWVDYRWAEIDPLLDNVRFEYHFKNMLELLKSGIDEQKKLIIIDERDEKI